MKLKLAHVNTGLLAAIILINAYIILLPFLPGLLFRLQHIGNAQEKRLQLSLHAKAMPSPAQNRLIVPAMLLDEPINDGKDISTLRKGLWRLPNTSTPDTLSNTVIVGHRFTYTNPRGTFYHLDALHVGDEVGVAWQGKKYLYKVAQTIVVPATAIQVEAPTNKPQLTLYTCAPLWWPKNRLVVTANLEKVW